MKDRDDRLRPYLEAIPDILQYQLATKLMLMIWLFILGRMFRLLLNSTGRVAVTSGDFLFLFGTWQGVLIILIALITLAIYVALDLNAKIIMSKNLLTGEEVPILKSFNQAIESIARLLNLKGIGILLYILLIAPLFGIGFSIALTEGLYIPTFISSVIGSNPTYLILAIIVSLFFIFFGIANLYILHGIVIEELPVEEAGKLSKELMRNNWKDFLQQNIAFVLVMGAVLGIVALMVLVLPLLITSFLPFPPGIKRGLTIFFLLMGIILSVLTDLLATPFYMMKMTQLYCSYRTGEELHYKPRKTNPHKYDVFAIIALLLVASALSFYLNQNFDRLFPIETSVEIIAHRAGGTEGAENTVSGLEKAATKGAYGSEIDIQRTKDGYYVLNHDSNFERVAGDARKPEELTLSEIRKLSVDGEPIPTLEEILDASRGKVTLFIELKGNSADQKMADDAVRIVKEKGMTDEAVLISLKYDLINYIEKTYPEMQTGFLTFAAFGDTALLNCDYLGLEEESATAYSINAVHKQGKKVLIWTANKKESQRHFLCSRADGVITDEVSQANEVLQEIKNRSDLTRMIDRIRELFS